MRSILYRRGGITLFYEILLTVNKFFAATRSINRSCLWLWDSNHIHIYNYLTIITINIAIKMHHHIYLRYHTTSDKIKMKSASSTFLSSLCIHYIRSEMNRFVMHNIHTKTFDFHSELHLWTLSCSLVVRRPTIARRANEVYNHNPNTPPTRPNADQLSTLKASGA